MSFASDVAKFAQKAGKSVDETGRTIVLELFGIIIQDTPADTGRARGNWQTTIGSPASGEISRAGEDGALADLEREVGSFGAGKTIYLANNLPYAWKLEYGGYGTGPGSTEKTTRDGYSVQAPYGMVRKNVARIQSIVKKAAQDNKV
jgi:hypothetical protein